MWISCCFFWLASWREMVDIFCTSFQLFSIFVSIMNQNYRITPCTYIHQSNRFGALKKNTHTHKDEFPSIYCVFLSNAVVSIHLNVHWFGSIAFDHILQPFHILFFLLNEILPPFRKNNHLNFGVRTYYRRLYFKWYISDMKRERDREHCFYMVLVFCFYMVLAIRIWYGAHDWNVLVKMCRKPNSSFIWRGLLTNQKTKFKWNQHK